MKQVTISKKGRDTFAKENPTVADKTFRVVIKSWLIAFATIFLMTCAPQQTKNGEWVPLFNGKDLTGWDTYLSFSHKEGADKTPYGLNNDPEQIFTVVKEDGQPAIRVAGDVGGGISTWKEFENYHLSLQFKWGEAMPWKTRKKRDSGLLYHAVGPHGVAGGHWMRSQEFQIQEGDCGDYWGVAGGIFDIPATQKDKNTWVYDKEADRVTFKEKTPIGRHCDKNPDGENPTGEWNTLELYCLGSTSVHVVNGVVTMVLYNSRQGLEGEVETPLTKGKIQLQSEGAELFYRDVKIRKITSMPEGLL